jgi:hypothetical protein
MERMPFGEPLVESAYLPPPSAVANRAAEDPDERFVELRRFDWLIERRDEVRVGPSHRRKPMSDRGQQYEWKR